MITCDAVMLKLAARAKLVAAGLCFTASSRARRLSWLNFSPISSDSRAAASSWPGGLTQML
jgi:hypothetical protein